MSGKATPVRAAIVGALPNLTATERKLANTVLANYPFNGLQTVTELAESTGVSAPSITRFVAKLGFSGYQEFQRRLIDELKETRQSPLDLMTDGPVAVAGAFLNDYASRVSQIMQQMIESISEEQFEAIVTLLADPGRQIFVLGGRITDSLARYLSLHLQQVRDRVFHLPAHPDLQPEYLLRMRRQDVLILFDFRRYQPDLARLANIVRSQRRAQIVLITDKWMSPIARDATSVFGLPIGIGTAWDSGVAAVALAEALIVRLSDVDWPTTRARIEALDTLRQETGVPLSRKPD